jgi:hypothetical protein
VLMNLRINDSHYEIVIGFTARMRRREIAVA